MTANEIALAMAILADDIVPQRPPEPVPDSKPLAPCARNADCPCGSGRKYKKCCRPNHMADSPLVRLRKLCEEFNGRHQP
jgi:hypothetical protein